MPRLSLSFIRVEWNLVSHRGYDKLTGLEDVLDLTHIQLKIAFLAASA
jgi:hypothetical protein